MMTMTKEELRAEMESTLRASADNDNNLINLVLAAWDKGYDSGFSTGVTHGLDQAARIQEMVHNAIQ